jgi:hypothetical protein
MKNKKSFSNFFFRPEFRGLIILLLLLLNDITIAQEQSRPSEEFIIGTPIFHELSTNPDIFNSFVELGMNTIHQRADNDTKNLLDSYNLVAYNTKNEFEYIHYYSSAYYSKWEAEQNLTGEDTARVGFKHKGGQSAYWYDPELNDTVLCWSTEELSAPACSLMYGPHYRQDKLYKRWYGYNNRYDLKYTPRFRMALDNHGGADLNEDVCVIKVVFRYKNPDDSLHYDTTFIARTLKVGDFDTSGKFDDFYLNPIPLLGWYEYYPGFILPEKFTLIEGSQLAVNFIDWESYTGIQFWVDWLMDDTLCTLYIDYAEVYDNDGWNAYLQDPIGVSDSITAYAQSFSDWNNITYWGGTDEPYSIDCYTPIRIVDSLIQKVNPNVPLLVTFNPTWWHTFDVNGEDEVLPFYDRANLDKFRFNYLPKELIRKKYLEIENLK